MIRIFCDRCKQEMEKPFNTTIGTKQFDLCKDCSNELLNYRNVFLNSFTPKQGGFLLWKKKQIVVPQAIQTEKKTEKKILKL